MEVLANLGHEVARGTVSNILKAHGIEPAPERSKRMPWSTFLKSHWGCIAATGLFTVEVWSRFGLTRYCVLFFIKLSNRRVCVAGVTTQPHASWIKQIARNTTGPVDGFLLGVRYWIMDRDAIFTAEFRDFLKQEGTKAVRLPPRSPNLNPFAERIIGSIRRDCLDHVIVFSEAHLMPILTSYFAYYHEARTHLSLGRNAPVPPRVEHPCEGKVIAISQVGGLHHRYTRAA